MRRKDIYSNHQKMTKISVSVVARISGTPYILELEKRSKQMTTSDLNIGQSCYWRFKDEKRWRYGYPTRLKDGLIMMGLWNGDRQRGTVVDPNDIEVRKYG